MFDIKIDGRLQVTAAMGLLKFSRLVLWDEASATFSPTSCKSYDLYWRENIDADFGRLICWINFSAGAEFLAKGICLLNGVEICKEKGGSRNFGTLRNLHGKGHDHDALRRLCSSSTLMKLNRDRCWTAMALWLARSGIGTLTLTYRMSATITFTRSLSALSRVSTF